MNNEFTKLRLLAEQSQKKSYAPYSKVHVGAAVEMENGKLFGGCNIENSSFGNTICAERVAIFQAILNGGTKIKKVYVLTEEGWGPCGSCRQVLQEFASDDLIVIIGSHRSPQNEKIFSFQDLFPFSFGPQQLK